MTNRYLTTGEAAAALGIPPSTLRRWVRKYGLDPADTTLGGHYRWDLTTLRRQLDAMRESGAANRGYLNR